MLCLQLKHSENRWLAFTSCASTMIGFFRGPLSLLHVTKKKVGRKHSLTNLNSVMRQIFQGFCALSRGFHRYFFEILCRGRIFGVNFFNEAQLQICACICFVCALHVCMFCVLCVFCVGVSALSGSCYSIILWFIKFRYRVTKYVCCNLKFRCTATSTHAPHEPWLGLVGLSYDPHSCMINSCAAYTVIKRCGLRAFLARVQVQFSTQ